jgi:ribosomal protein S18 acetylase RimI-like enzyme
VTERRLRPATRDDATQLLALIDIASRGLLVWVWTQMTVQGQSALEVGRNRIRDREDLPSHFSKWTILENSADVIGGVAGYSIPTRYNPGDIAGLPSLYAPMLELEALAAGTWYLMALAVFPEFRRKGHATAMLEFAERKARGEEFSRMTIMVNSSNIDALRLYHRREFHEIATRPYIPFPGSRDSGEWILLEKQLHSN